MTANLKSPYADILPRLVRSVMLAQASIIEALANGDKIESVPDRLINRHFSWLRFAIKQGMDRHIFDGTPDETILSLSIAKVTNINSLPENLKVPFERGHSISIEDEFAMKNYVRDQPTRISRILKCEFSGYEVIEVKERSRTTKDLEKAYTTIPSPLLICQKILTVPDSLGSTGYSFLALRNYLIQVADTLSDQPISLFKERDLIDEMEAVRTFFRPRYRSKGKDALVRGKGFGWFLREFLCLTGLYNYRFKDPSSCIEFLTRTVLGINLGNEAEIHSCEYTRRAHLEKLPEIGDLANQIWGLPLPIRGADVLFRGGIKFPERQGLVASVHGGAGSGKTSFALGVGAALAGFGIKTLYFSAEEKPADLKSRAESLVPATYRRLSFYPAETSTWLDVVHYNLAFENDRSAVERITDYFELLGKRLDEAFEGAEQGQTATKSPCSLVVVLDGLHDLINRSPSLGLGAAAENGRLSDVGKKFHELIERCKSLKALVILTAGTSWEFSAELDYLVDTAMHISHDTGPQDGGKPERLLNLSKTRHQSCSAGTHGFQISGEKGVRFTPQTNFCLDLDSIWGFRLPDSGLEKRCFTRVAVRNERRDVTPVAASFSDSPGIKLYRSSNIFLNGQGSGGKAGMALKIASAPYFEKGSKRVSSKTERTLIISFLYPPDYYSDVHDKIIKLRKQEYDSDQISNKHSRFDVVHFYPGFLRPASLFSRIEGQIKNGELMGDPYTTVIIDGLHNVFIQFPELEKRQIIWPQLFSMLRRRDVTIITTHTVLTVSIFDDSRRKKSINVDDYRSDPLRHALVQKTDFSFEVDPVQSSEDQGKVISGKLAAEYEVTALSAISQPLPNKDHRLYWHREGLYFYVYSIDTQLPLPLPKNNET
jgi:hypothetical protein